MATKRGQLPYGQPLDFSFKDLHRVEGMWYGLFVEVALFPSATTHTALATPADTNMSPISARSMLVAFAASFRVFASMLAQLYESQMPLIPWHQLL